MCPHNTQQIQYIAYIDNIVQAQPKARAEKSVLAMTEKGMVMMWSALSNCESYDGRPGLDPIALQRLRCRSVP
jgi:hypothetical protein